MSATPAEHRAPNLKGASVHGMRDLVVKVTVGAEAPERTNQAFTVASAGKSVV